MLLERQQQDYRLPLVTLVIGTKSAPVECGASYLTRERNKCRMYPFYSTYFG